MKHKAKPAKGSARTKRFDVGGTVGALAGLGTLAYLMSRKKKGETGKEFGPQGKFPEETSEEKATPKREEYVPADKEELDAKKAALSGGMQYKKPEAGVTTSESKPVRVIKKKDGKKDSDSNVILPATDKYAGATKSSAEHAEEIKDKFDKFDPDPNKGKYQNTRADAIRGALPGKKPYTDSSGVVYNERGEPYANTTANKKPADKKPADKKPADKKQEATTGAKRTRYAKKKVEEPKRNTGPKRTRYAKKQVTDKKYSSGGSVSSASKRADGIAIRGKTRA
jgi:hypothetical protein